MVFKILNLRLKRNRKFAFLAGSALLWALLSAGSYHLIAEEVVPPVQVAQSSLASYRALYDLSIAKPTMDSPIQDIRGKMYYEIQENCDGWIIKQDIISYLTDDSDEQKVSKSNYTIWESKDHTKLSFHFRSYLNDEQSEDISGEATLSPDEDGENVVVFKTPEAVKLTLDKNTIFPIAQLISMSRNPDQFNGMQDYHLFDGTSFNEGVIMSSFVTQFKEKLQSPQLVALSSGEKPKNIHMAFFAPLDSSDRSSYEMDVGIDSHGVQHYVSVIYPEFSLVSKMTKFENLDSKKDSCPI